MTVRYEDVQKAIIEGMNVSAEELAAKKGKGKVREARNMQYSIMYHYMRMTFQQVADGTGRLNHATISSGIDSHKDLLATDLEYRRLYLKIVSGLFPAINEKHILSYECKKLLR